MLPKEKYQSFIRMGNGIEGRCVTFFLRNSKKKGRNKKTTALTGSKNIKITTLPIKISIFAIKKTTPRIICIQNPKKAGIVAIIQKK
jgi:hypothetical protein